MIRFIPEVPIWIPAQTVPHSGKGSNMSLSPSRSVRGRMITGCLPAMGSRLWSWEHQMLGSSAQLIIPDSIMSITMRRGEGVRLEQWGCRSKVSRIWTVVQMDK